jgi:exodeoxyribonuclease VII small subunit
MPADSSAPGGDAISFEKALEELEKLVSRMEDGKLPLEESLEAYQRGTELIKLCQAKLTAAQARVAILEGEALRDFKPDRNG